MHFPCWRIRVWEQRSGGKYTTCSAPVAPVVMSCRPPCNTTEMFWLRRRVQTAAGCLFTIFTPLLLQTAAGCCSPDPPPPDRDCMRALTHGECDQLKLCWARIPGVGGGWQRHDRNGFRGRGGGEGSHPTPSLLVSWAWHRFRGPGPAALIYRVPASRSPAITAQG